MEPGEEEPGGVGGAEVIREELEGEGARHEGSSFFPQRKAPAPICASFTFTFYNESKTVTCNFLFSKQRHVTRAREPKHVMQS